MVDGVTLASGGYDPTASVNGGPYAIVASGPTDSTGSGFDTGNYDITFLRGEYVYDQFVRAEDQWRTIDALLAVLFYRGDIRYGDPAPKDDVNLVQMNSFDLFD